MEQKNRIDHYKIQSVLLWFGICFLLQILLLLMQEFQYDGEHYQPLLYLFGKKYGKNAFYATSETMMFLTQLTYCIMVIRRIAKKREENAYMIIPRYKSFRAYYGSVYRELVGYTFLYQTAILTGSIVGYIGLFGTLIMCRLLTKDSFWDHRYVCLWENCFSEQSCRFLFCAGMHFVER